MATESFSFIFLNAVLANNFVLAMFLGLCPFLGVSGKLNTALPMGLATLFVMLVSSTCAYLINWVLVAFDIEFLRLIAYIAVIASAVQLVEMTLKKFSPAPKDIVSFNPPISPFPGSFLKENPKYIISKRQIPPWI